MLRQGGAAAFSQALTGAAELEAEEDDVAQGQAPLSGPRGAHRLGAAAPGPRQGCAPGSLLARAACAPGTRAA
eukprot:2182971-Lingulodinium_polyedra.AAC.1